MGRISGSLSVQLTLKSTSRPLDAVYLLSLIQYGVSVGDAVLLPLVKDIEHEFLFDVDIELLGTLEGVYFVVTSVKGTSLVTVYIDTRPEVNLEDYATIVLKRAFSQSTLVDYAETGLFEIEALGTPFVYNVVFGIKGVFTGWGMLKEVTKWIEEDIKQSLGVPSELQFYNNIGNAEEARLWAIYRKNDKYRLRLPGNDYIDEYTKKSLVPGPAKKSSHYFDTKENPDESHWFFSRYNNVLQHEYSNRPLLNDYDFIPLLTQWKAIKSLQQSGDVSVWNHKLENPFELGVELALHPFTMGFRVAKYALDTLSMALSHYTGLQVYDGRQSLGSVFVNAVQTMTYYQSVKYGAHIGRVIGGPYGLILGAYLGGSMNILLSSFASQFGKNVIYQYGTKPVAEYAADVVEAWSPNQVATYLQNTQYHRKGFDLGAQLSANIIAQLLLGFAITRMPRAYRIGAAGQQIAVYENGLRMGAGVLEQGVRAYGQLGQYVQDLDNYQQNRVQLYNYAGDFGKKSSKLLNSLKQSVFTLAAYGMENKDKPLIDAQSNVIQQNYNEFMNFLRDEKSTITTSMIPRIQQNLYHISNTFQAADPADVAQLERSLTVLDYFLKNERLIQDDMKPQWAERVRVSYNAVLNRYTQIIENVKPEWMWNKNPPPPPEIRNVLQLPDVDIDLQLDRAGYDEVVAQDGIKEALSQVLGVAKDQVFKVLGATQAMIGQAGRRIVNQKVLGRALISSGAAAGIHSYMQSGQNTSQSTPGLHGNRTLLSNYTNSTSLNNTIRMVPVLNTTNNTFIGKDPLLMTAEDVNIENVLRKDARLQQLVSKYPKGTKQPITDAGFKQYLAFNPVSIKQPITDASFQQYLATNPPVYQPEGIVSGLKKKTIKYQEKLEQKTNKLLQQLGDQFQSYKNYTDDLNMPSYSDISNTQMIAAGLLGATGTYALYQTLQSAPDEKIEAIKHIAQDQKAIQQIQSDFDRLTVFNNSLHWEPSSRKNRNLHRVISMGRHISRAIDSTLEEAKKIGIRRRLIYYQ